jgi:IS5 family transposase
VDVDWLIAERPGKVRTLKQHPRKNKTAINIEYMKASIRAKVEHPFRIIKRQFGFVKARYKGLLKNDNQLAMLFTLANLFRADQMIRQWEISLKTGNNALNGEETVNNKLNKRDDRGYECPAKN